MKEKEVDSNKTAENVRREREKEKQREKKASVDAKIVDRFCVRATDRGDGHRNEE